MVIPMKPKIFYSDIVAVNAVATVGDMPIEYENSQVFFEFVDGATSTTQCRPTAGSVDVTASTTGLDYSFGEVTGGTALDITTDNYDRLTFPGIYSHIKVTPNAAISGGGATHYRVGVARW